MIRYVTGYLDEADNFFSDKLKAIESGKQLLKGGFVEDFKNFVDYRVMMTISTEEALCFLNNMDELVSYYKDYKEAFENIELY